MKLSLLALLFLNGCGTKYLVGTWKQQDAAFPVTLVLAANQTFRTQQVFTNPDNAEQLAGCKAETLIEGTWADTDKIELLLSPRAGWQTRTGCLDASANFERREADIDALTSRSSLRKYSIDDNASRLTIWEDGMQSSTVYRRQ